MGYFQDMGLLFLYSIAILLWKEPSRATVFAILWTVILICGMYFVQKKYAKIVVCAAFVLTSMAVPEARGFYPILVYVLTRETNGIAGAAGIVIGVFLMTDYDSVQTGWIAKFVIGCLIAIVLERKTDKYNKMDMKLKRIADAGEEKALLLSEKNKALLEKQNSEIYAATLRERNRIAREIHDNVGHVLSRTILLTGAARAVNKDRNMDSLLEGLDTSLNSAMDSIRSSVHDLHDDAVNLRKTIKDIISDIKEKKVEFKYDMSDIIPRDVKYAFISITKEALSNTTRYGGATRVKIVMREHPAMYQLYIEDNGKGCRDYNKNTTGIGLKNMQERVSALNGTLQIDGEKGFHIFIMIPKQNMQNSRKNEDL